MVPTPQQMALFDEGQALVHSLAMTIMRRLPVRLDLEDLIAYGQLGLAEAAMSYQDNRQTRFTTFAYYRIKGAIFDGVSQMSWTKRGQMRRRRRQQEAIASTSTGAAADPADSSTSRFAVIGRSYHAEGESSAADVAEDWTPSPLAAAVNREIATQPDELVQSLPVLPRRLLQSIYYEGLSMQEAATRLGISKSWASRVHAQALQQLGLALRKLGVD